MHESDKLRVRRRVARELELEGPAKVELVVLPVMRTQLAPVSRERRVEFANGLEDVLYARPDRNKVPTTPTPLDDAAIAALCGACRGSCCKTGENHAYLTKPVLARVKKERRLASHDALIDAYVTRIPDIAVADSCIFHTETGCALPRSMRGDMCNRHLCFPLRQLGRGFGQSGYAQVAVSRVDDGEDRVVVLEDGHVRVD